MKSLLFVSLLFVLFSTSCENKNNTNTANEIANQDSIKKEPANTIKKAEEPTLADFWSTYQTAIAAKDIEKLKSMSNKDIYDDLFFMMFQGPIAKSTADQIKPAEGKEEGTYEFSFTDIPQNPQSEEEAEGGGGSLFIKKDAEGKFKIIDMVAFG